MSGLPCSAGATFVVLALSTICAVSHERHLSSTLSATLVDARTLLAEDVSRSAPERTATEGAAGLSRLRKYHSSDSIYAKISALQSTCLAPLTVEWIRDDAISNSSANATGRLFVARVGPRAARKRVLIAASEHARELIASEIALRLLQKLCSSAEAQAVLERVHMVVLPVLNEGGRRLVESGENPCQRETLDKVDINRNMDVDWGQGESQDWGPAPFSSFQARLLQQLASRLKPLAYIDLHSGSRSLMTSWGFKAAATPDFQDQRRLLEVVRRKHCQDCDVGPNSVVMGYKNPGEVIDHMYDKEGIKYSSLWEVYRGNAPMEDCLSFFNPPDPAYDALTDNWAEALITVAHFVDQEVSADERPRRQRPRAAARRMTFVQNSLQAVVTASAKGSIAALSRRRGDSPA
eukprot:TRINITY_DN122124_c0_g1_i1.p1 TRINITY_DN122124_c0_g1~~TRINITY_DN122124_c0_g1_i1.p1  ORF type:complete len:407 (+),score=79.98 TRINITY_DN122124_c0_g1_i1:59-1279(+)